MDKQIQVKHGKHVEFRSIPIHIFRKREDDNDEGHPRHRKRYIKML